MFSQYIRLRDCLKTTGDPDRGKCVTCPQEFERKQLTAGHYVPDRSRYLLFDERGVHGQCVQCNIYKKGNWVPYRKFMLETYGEAVTLEVESNKDKTGSWSVPELQEVNELYKKKFTDLAKSVGITS